MKKTKVTLGIDLGSTSTRAVLGPKHVQETNRNMQSLRFSAGDFSSSIYPFDAKGPIYLYEMPDPTRKSVSAKYAFYSLVDASDELLEQYPMVHELMNGRDDAAFQQRLREGLEQLFSRLKCLIDGMCKEYRYEIDTIGLSVPSQWTLDFEDLYRAIIVKVFGPRYKNKVVIVYETEALGRFLCTGYSDKLLRPDDGDQGQGSVRHDALLFFDFGGHNMNTCTFNIVYDEKGTPSFYLISRPKGAGGGSEQWEYDLAQSAIERIERDGGRRLPPDIRQEILDGLNRNKGRYGPTYGDSVYLFKTVVGDTEPLLIPFDPETLCRYFDEALRRPLELARERIEELKGIKNIRPRVVVSGGTARHKGLQHKLREMCEDNGIAPPFFTDTLDMPYDSMKIAQGTMYAASNRTTIQQFFVRGAAIGLQRQPHAPRGDPNREGQWEYLADFLLSKTRQVTWEGKVTGTDRQKLICHPFYEVRNSQGQTLEHYRCYDLLELGQPLKGSWRIALSLTGRGDDVELVMERHHKSFTARRYRRFDRRTFPLWYNRGENCIHVGFEGEDNDELLGAPCRYPRVQGKKKGMNLSAIGEEDLGDGVDETEQEEQEEKGSDEDYVLPDEYENEEAEKEEDEAPSEESLESVELVDVGYHLRRNSEELRRLDEEIANFDFTSVNSGSPSELRRREGGGGSGGVISSSASGTAASALPLDFESMERVDLAVAASLALGNMPMETAREEDEEAALLLSPPVSSSSRNAAPLNAQRQHRKRKRGPNEQDAKGGRGRTDQRGPLFKEESDTHLAAGFNT
ncbi:uncharacterized protein PG986_010690 [Apiospora aurea]|uniref:Actin-like ATPase domain-containing protein n=1 Tax=Apiospora aurea TaxID=335848 RepID=A0ABR1Q301_9PEZI